MTTPDTYASHADIFDQATEIILTVSGVEIPHQDILLRDYIPNSLTFIQILLALEEGFGIALDYSQFGYDATVGDLVAIIHDNLTKGSQQNSISSISDSDDVDENIPLNPIQVAYILGSEPDIELGGQATFIYMETCHQHTAADVYEAITSIFNRHDAVGYSIDLENGQLVPAQTPQFSVTIKHGIPVTELRQQLQQAASASNDSGPMISAYIVADADNTTRLMIYFNMIIMDAGSVYIFYDALARQLAGESLPEVLTYRDAVKIGSITDKQKQDAQEYWSKRALQLPARPDFGVEVRGSDWSTTRLSLRLDADLVEKLERRAHALGVTISALILATHSAVVARWLNAPGLTVNVTVSQRPTATSAVLGDFTSSILVGADVAAADTFAHLAAAVGHDISTALQYRGMSGVEVMQNYLRGDLEQGIATAPIVFTSYIGGNRAGQSLPTIDYVYTQTAQVCLDIQVMPVGDELAISWDYVPEYFPHAHAMFARLRAALNDVAHGDEILPLLDPETESAVAQYNDTATELSDDTLVSLVREGCLRYPQRVAVKRRIDDISYSYEELWQLSGKIAAMLRAKGCTPEDRVIVEYTRHPNDVINILGVLRVGAAYVPVDSKTPKARSQAIRESAAAFPVVLTTDAIEQLEPSEGYEDAQSAPDIPADSLAYIIFTSGTTGRPKGVEITHRACVNTIKDVNRRYELHHSDTIIGLSSLSFDLSVFDIFGALACGATLTMVADERDADEIVDVLAHDRVTIWNSAPALLELALLRIEPGQSFPHLRIVMLSGDRIAAGLPGRAMAVFPHARINSLGGATEASIWSIQFPLAADSLDSRIPYGYPLDNQGIHVLSYDLRTCPIGTRGELWISGVGVASGYANDPERTAAAFVDIPGLGRCYRTGDQGIFNDQGFVEFCGRLDRQVKVSGYRIELGEIESTLDNSSLVVASVATIINSDGRQVLVCLYVPVDDTVTPDRIRAELEAFLPRYMIPTHIVAVAEIPVTSNGKLDARMVQEQLGHSSQSITGTASQTTIDIVRKIWIDLLGESPQINADDAQFFHCGGDSLTFQLMLRRIYEQTGVRLRFRDVIIAPTIVASAQLIDAQSQGQKAEVVQLASSAQSDYDAQDPYAPFPLTDMQMAYFVGRNSSFELGGVTEHYYIESIADVDIIRLERSLNELIERHPMLRVVFTKQGQQRILPTVPHYHIKVTDLTDASAEELEQAIMQQREAMSHEKFDLEKWPLFDISAMMLPDGCYRLFFSVDMIIGDGASQQIFIQDLSKLYAGETLPPVRGDYRRYVLAMTEHKKHREPAITIPEVQRLIANFPSGNVLSPSASQVTEIPRMQRLSRLLDNSETEALAQAAREKGVSVSSVLLAAYATSLSLWSLSGDVGINITTYNRDADVGEVTDVFGDFTGMVLLDVQQPALRPFPEVTAEMQRRLLEHLDIGYSGVEVISQIAKEHGMIGKAVAPFVFTSLLFTGPQNRTDATVLGNVDYALSQTPQVLLDNQVMMLDRKLSISWDFVEQVLDPVIVADIFDHFIRTVLLFSAGEPQAASLAPMQIHRLKKNLSITKQSMVPGSPAHKNVTPADDIVAKIFTIAARYGIADGIDMNENLFDAGVDSLGFVQLVNEIEQATGKEIPLAEALALPTVAALASLVTEVDVVNNANSMMLLRSGKPTQPVVLVHGGFGTIDIYRDIALSLPEDYQVWGMQFTAFAHEYPQHLELTDIARHYVQELSDVLDPDAQISVIGWSLGGSLAVEMAALLGSRCDKVIMVDSLAPGVQVDTGDFSLDSERAIIGRYFEQIPPCNSVAELWAWAVEHAESEGGQGVLVRRMAEDISSALVEDLGVMNARTSFIEFNTLRTLINARNRFIPTSHITKALFVLPDDGESNNYIDWQSYIGQLEVQQVEGNHYSVIFGDDSRMTSSILAEYLERQ